MQLAKPTQWVTAAQLAELCQLSQQHIYNMSKLPNCPVIKIGRQNRYDPEQFQAWLANGGPNEGRKQELASLREQYG